jgi:hypothetical protein
MKKFKIGPLDYAAAGVVLVAILLPAPSKKVHPVYAGEAAARAAALASAQADLARNPKDRQALGRVADLLVANNQTDWALRVTGGAASEPAPDQWRAMLAVSGVHADRLDVKEAYDWGARALAACNAPGSECPDHERVRVELYVKAVKAGLDSGIDPRVDAEGFEHAVNAANPMIRIGGRKNHPPF